MPHHPIAALLAARILEDAALIEELLALIPEGREDWRPPNWPAASPDRPFTIARLRAHLAESLAGICACLHRLHPERLAHLDAMRDGSYCALRQAAAAAFPLVTDADFTRNLPTVFAPSGAPFLETLLINWKHLLNHGYQLFTYLKLLDVPVNTRHLYRFRE
jgi:hypothetical protein